MPCNHCPRRALPPMDGTERALLAKLGELAYLPVCRYLARSPENPELSFVMSAPVYLEDADASPETVRRFGEALLSLQRRGYLTLDYGVPIAGADYGRFRASKHFAAFAAQCAPTQAEPFLEEGSAGLTVQGQEAADGLA